MNSQPHNDEGGSSPEDKHITAKQWAASPIRDASPEEQRHVGEHLQQALEEGLPVVFEDALGLPDGTPIMLNGRQVLMRTVMQRNTKLKTVVIDGKPATPKQLSRIRAKYPTVKWQRVLEG